MYSCTAFIEPNSPDLNPVDYCIWGALQQLVYRQQVRDIEHLKNVLVTSWEQISQFVLIVQSDSFRNDKPQSLQQRAAMLNIF